MERITMLINSARSYTLLASSLRSKVYLDRARECIKLVHKEREKACKATNLIDMSQYLTDLKKVA